MTPEEFKEILAKNASKIIGGPKVGKTTLANLATDRVIHHNDDGKHIPWEDQPQHWIDKATQDKFVIEGVHASRALRKGLQVDAIVHLDEPRQELSKGQASMHKGQQKIIKEALEKHPYVPVYK